MDSLLSRLDAYKPQLRQSLRVTAAALAAYAVNLELQFQQGYWMAFTAILIVQGSVGGSVKAAVERMTGTLAGAAYGALISTLIPHDTPPLFVLTVVAGLAPAAFAASLSSIFRIAPITVAILLFGNTAQRMSPVVFAEHRTAEIAAGCVIGLIASLTILPARAHNLLAEAAAAMLGRYTGLLAKQMDMAEREVPDAEIDPLYAEIRAKMAKLDVTAEEARRERKSYLTGEPDPEPLVRMVRRVRNDLVMVGRSVARPLPAGTQPALLGPLKETAAAATEFLNAAAAVLTGPSRPARPAAPLEAGDEKAVGKLDAGFGSFAAAMAALPIAGADNDANRLFTLNFALGQLHQNLKDLADRAAEFRTGDEK